MDTQDRSARVMESRTALVTGAGHNIGRAIAHTLAAAGAAVAVSDIDETAAKTVVDEIIDRGGRAATAIGDISDPVVVDRIFDQVESELGPVDALVNNAYARVGATSFKPFLQVTVEDWRSFVDQNSLMFFATTQRMARVLASRGLPGTVVNISSHGAARAHREHIPYDAVKGAMESFTRAVAVDLAPWQIRVNAVRPGSIAVVDERMDWDAAGAEQRNLQIPLGRPGTGDDVAGSVLFLASHLSSYVTGQVFNVDGGMAAQARAAQVEPHLPVGPHSGLDFPTHLLDS